MLPSKTCKNQKRRKTSHKTQTAEEQAHQSRLNADAEVEEVVRFCFEIVNNFYDTTFL